MLLRLKSPHSFLIITQVTCFKLSHLNNKDVTEFTVLPERRRQDKGMKGIRKETDRVEAKDEDMKKPIHCLN